MPEKSRFGSGWGKIRNAKVLTWGEAILEFIVCEFYGRPKGDATEGKTAVFIAVWGLFELELYLLIKSENYLSDKKLLASPQLLFPSHGTKLGLFDRSSEELILLS